MEIEVLEIRIDARRQRRAKLSRSRSPRHLARFLTRNRTSIPRNSPRILATFPPLSPYVPNRGEDKLLSTLWRNREIFARAIQVRRITNEEAVFVEYEIEKFFLILFHLSRIHSRIENRQRSLVSFAAPGRSNLLFETSFREG